MFDQGTEDRLCRQIVDGFRDEDLSEPFFKIYNGPCTEEAVVEMAKEAQAEYCDMVVGIGGGKMLDIAFYDGAKRTISMAKAAGVYKGDL